jgi:hypothetical protein
VLSIIQTHDTRGLKQIGKFLARAAKAYAAGKLTDISKPIVERIMASRRKHAIVVFPELPPLTLEPGLHQCVKDALSSASVAGLDTWMLVSAGDLEWVLALGLGDRLSELLEGYAAVVSGKPLFIDGGRSIPLTFGDFARRAPGARQTGALPSLEAIYWRFVDKVNIEWFGQPARRRPGR